MPEHSPTSAFIGVGGVGAGVLLLYCAYKNVNPVALLKQVVETGNLDTSKLPKLFGGLGGNNSTVNPPDAPGNPNKLPGPNLPGGGQGPPQRLPGGGNPGLGPGN